MAYEFKPSGVSFQKGFNHVPVATISDADLVEDAQRLIEELAVATGNSPALVPGKITGSFCIVFERDRDGNGMIGLLPAAAINADIVNAS